MLADAQLKRITSLRHIPRRETVGERGTPEVKNNREIRKTASRAVSPYHHISLSVHVFGVSFVTISNGR